MRGSPLRCRRTSCRTFSTGYEEKWYGWKKFAKSRSLKCKIFECGHIGPSGKLLDLLQFLINPLAWLIRWTESAYRVTTYSCVYFTVWFRNSILLPTTSTWVNELLRQAPYNFTSPLKNESQNNEQIWWQAWLSCQCGPKTHNPFSRGKPLKDWCLSFYNVYTTRKNGTDFSQIHMHLIFPNWTALTSK